MLAPIFQDPSFNQGWMAHNKRLRDAISQGAASVGYQTYSSTSSTSQTEQTEQSEQAEPSEPSNAVTTASEGSPSRSSIEKAESSKESEKKAKKVELTPEERQIVGQLQTTDRNVRAHEQAHLNAAQGIAISAANYSYQVGPDDKRYAVAGEVTIDTSKESEPEKTIDKGYRIIRAALAPADPSTQDRSVAANAKQMILNAQAELMRATYTSNQELKEDDGEGKQRTGSTIDQQV